MPITVVWFFTASRDSCRLKSKKVMVTGHGIDLNSFCPQDEGKTIDLITVGRIASSKNLVTLIVGFLLGWLFKGLCTSSSKVHSE